MLRDFIALTRPKHYLKNTLVFIPILFSGHLLQDHHFTKVLVGAIVFSLVASTVYIINDIQDVEKDRHHSKKKFRPLASGTVSVTQAAILATLLAAAAVAIGYVSAIPLTGWLLLITYLVINIGYSVGLKNVPVLDVAILAAGFLIRVLYGGAIVNVDVSRWLYLTVLAGAFYMGLGKRRGELLTNGTKSRKVNEFYTHNFLDKNMVVCSALTLVFYSLWATDPSRHTRSLFWTIPVFIVLIMTYSLDIEKEGAAGDPVDVLLNNKILAVFAFIYVAITIGLLYA